VQQKPAVAIAEVKGPDAESRSRNAAGGDLVADHQPHACLLMHPGLMWRRVPAMPKKLTTAQRDQVLTHPPSLAHPVAHHPGGSPLKQESGATAEPHQADHLDQVMARAHRRHPDARTAERRQAHHLDEAIRQAEAAGGFADLQGKGKPLAFRREAGLATQDERWLTNHILKRRLLAPVGRRKPRRRAGP